MEVLFFQMEILFFRRQRALENLNSAFKILDKNEETLNIILKVIHE